MEVEHEHSNPKMIDEETSADGNFISNFFGEIISSPLNICLLLAICFLLYKILKGRTDDTNDFPPPPPPLPKLKKRDLTIQELRKFDGTDSSGRIMVAINGKVFDVTRGKRFYGPGGPYHPFAGHDASRALAMFQTDLVKDEHDDLSDLNSMQVETVKEWEAQLSEKYDFVGKLLKPGDEPSNYSDEEESGEVGESKEEVSTAAGAPAAAGGDGDSPLKSKDD